MSFNKLNISKPILRALEREGYKEPTKIQAEAIPPLLEGRDLLGCAQTGTGKTAAFAIPIIQRLSEERKAVKGRRVLKTLVLTPTRELAAQIGVSFASYGVYSGLRHTVVFGGVSQNPQVQALRSGVDILVATPGRLLDLMGQRVVDLKAISCFVLDEADRMLDMGFLRDVERIIGELPEKKQTMLFSATMPADIEKLTNRLLKDPVRVAVTPVASTVESVEQFLYYVNKSNKTKLLIHLLKDAGIYSALVFTRTKHGANKLAEALREAGENCDVIHANKSQQARQQALARFKSGKSRVLVATDIVARGIDIAELSHVVNFDIPESPEDYVHRIGRTGRAGLGGTAISFSDGPEKKYVSDIEWLTGRKLDVVQEHPYPLVASAETAGTAYGRAYGAGRQPYSGRGYSSRKSPNARYKRS
jgi:ATP-dependent RNA helicase RhlE